MKRRSFPTTFARFLCRFVGQVKNLCICIDWIDALQLQSIGFEAHHRKGYRLFGWRRPQTFFFQNDMEGVWSPGSLFHVVVQSLWNLKISTWQSSGMKLKSINFFSFVIFRWKWMPTLNCRRPARPASWTRSDNRIKPAKMAISKRPSDFTARPSRWTRATTFYSRTGRPLWSNWATLAAHYKTLLGPSNSTPNGQKWVQSNWWPSVKSVPSIGPAQTKSGLVWINQQFILLRKESSNPADHYIWIRAVANELFLTLWSVSSGPVDLCGCCRCEPITAGGPIKSETLLTRRSLFLPGYLLFFPTFLLAFWLSISL